MNFPFPLKILTHWSKLTRWSGFNNFDRRMAVWNELQYYTFYENQKPISTFTEEALLTSCSMCWAQENIVRQEPDEENFHLHLGAVRCSGKCMGAENVGEQQDRVIGEGAGRTNISGGIRIWCKSFVQLLARGLFLSQKHPLEAFKSLGPRGRAKSVFWCGKCLWNLPEVLTCACSYFIIQNLNNAISPVLCKQLSVK